MKIIGHRENTVDAIRRAIELGVDEIELDVRVTKDGVPVLNHDTRLDNIPGRTADAPPMAIHERTLAELRTQQPRLTTLDEAVVLIDRHVRLFIEVKPGVSTTEIIVA